MFAAFTDCVASVSTAGAHGPMQFLPSTFAAYGKGGDILSPRDSIMAAGSWRAQGEFAKLVGLPGNPQARHARDVTRNENLQHARGRVALSYSRAQMYP